MERAKLIGIAPQLVVKDVYRTATYYRDVFGFRIIGLVQDPPVYGMVERDGFQIHFAMSDGPEPRRNHELRSISYDLILWVPAIDAFFEELQYKSATILQGIVQRPYGSREFMIEDCDGHRILIGD